MSLFCFFFKQKTAYEMRISDWSSDVCSSDLVCIWFNRFSNEFIFVALELSTGHLTLFWVFVSSTVRPRQAKEFYVSCGYLVMWRGHPHRPTKSPDRKSVV